MLKKILPILLATLILAYPVVSDAKIAVKPGDWFKYHIKMAMEMYGLTVSTENDTTLTIKEIKGDTIYAVDEEGETIDWNATAFGGFALEYAYYEENATLPPVMVADFDLIDAAFVKYVTSAYQEAGLSGYYKAENIYWLSFKGLPKMARKYFVHGKAEYLGTKVSVEELWIYLSNGVLYRYEMHCNMTLENQTAKMHIELQLTDWNLPSTAAATPVFYGGVGGAVAVAAIAGLIIARKR